MSIVLRTTLIYPCKCLRNTDGPNDCMLHRSRMYVKNISSPDAGGRFRGLTGLVDYTKTCMSRPCAHRCADCGGLVPSVPTSLERLVLRIALPDFGRPLLREAALRHPTVPAHDGTASRNTTMRSSTRTKQEDRYDRWHCVFTARGRSSRINQTARPRQRWKPNHERHTRIVPNREAGKTSDTSEMTHTHRHTDTMTHRHTAKLVAFFLSPADSAG